MNYKTTLILALVLAIGIVSVVFLDKKEKKETASKETSQKIIVMTEQEAEQVFLQPSGIRIVRQPDGWKIVEPIETKADENTVRTLINTFDWAKQERVFAAQPSDYSTYGLDPYKGMLIITHKGISDTIYVGDKNVTGSLVYARKAGSPDVFLATTSLQSNLEKTLFDWRNKNIFSIQSTDVKKCVLNNPNGKFVLRRTGSDWLINEPVQALAERTNVGQIVSRLSTEKARAFVDENPASLTPFGLVRPKVQVELVIDENKDPLVLAIGNPVDGRYYARTSENPPVFTVDSSLVRLISPTLFHLRDKRMVFFNQNEIDRIEFEHSGKIVVCTKDTSGAWNVIEPEARQGKAWVIRDLLKNVTDLKVVEFVSESSRSLQPYGLAVPKSRTRFYIHDVLVYELLLGDIRNELIYAKRGDEPRVVMIKKEIFSKLTPKLDDIGLPVSDQQANTQ